VAEDPAADEPELGDDVERDHVTDLVASLLGELGGQACRRGGAWDRGGTVTCRTSKVRAKATTLPGQADQALHAEQVTARRGARIGGHRCSASKIASPALRPCPAIVAVLRSAYENGPQTR
jgi:hypothetical protein